MGRFTVFTVENCPKCMEVKQLFESLRVNIMEIPLTYYPDRRKDMLTLTDSLSVPQVFLNESHIGGLKETTNVMASWSTTDKESPAEYYESYIASSSDPKDARLRPVSGPPVTIKPPPPRRQELIKLPDGSYRTHLDFLRMLEKELPCDDLRYNLTTYRKCFRANDAVTVIAKQYELNRQEATDFLVRLQHKHHMLDHVVHEHTIQDKDALFFRLQCNMTPQILNSYRVWVDPVDPNAMELLRRLTKSLYEILEECTTPHGTVDYVLASQHNKFPLFEEAVCELREVQCVGMNESLKLAFTLNLHNLMIKYAFIKVGIPKTEDCRQQFMKGVCFRVGPHTLSFQDLIHGILQSNQKSSKAEPVELSDDDKRCRLGLPKKKNVYRILFALNYGGHLAPPQELFTEDAIDEELRISGFNFCAKKTNINFTGECVYLAKTLQPFIDDSGKSLVDACTEISMCLSTRKKWKMDAVLANGSSKIRYLRNAYWTTTSENAIEFNMSRISPQTRWFGPTK